MLAELASAHPVALLLFFLTLSLILFAHSHMHIAYDPHEPPIIRSKIPLVGHMIGMVQWGSKYFEILKYVSRSVIATIFSKYPKRLTDNRLIKIVPNSNIPFLQCLPLTCAITSLPLHL